MLAHSTGEYPAGTASPACEALKRASTSISIESKDVEHNDAQIPPWHPDAENPFDCEDEAEEPMGFGGKCDDEPKGEKTEMFPATQIDSPPEPSSSMPHAPTNTPPPPPPCIEKDALFWKLLSLLFKMIYMLLKQNQPKHHPSIRRNLD